MARGWESKDVESQLESASVAQGTSDKANKSPEQIRREQERKQLEMSRTRIVNSLEAATNPNHRKSLEAALAHLEQKLSELN